MPSAWSDKDERQYDKVKESAVDDGKSDGRASELAARVVNKQRRKEGRTPNERTQGTGNPNKPLDERTKDKLYNRAKQLGVTGRSTMNKKQLVAAIRRAS